MVNMALQQKRLTPGTGQLQPAPGRGPYGSLQPGPRGGSLGTMPMPRSPVPMQNAGMQRPGPYGPLQGGPGPRPLPPSGGGGMQRPTGPGMWGPLQGGGQIPGYQPGMVRPPMLQAGGGQLMPGMGGQLMPGMGGRLNPQMIQAMIAMLQGGMFR